MPEMVAKVAQEYPVGTKRSPGDRFHVEPAHAKLLMAIGRVEDPAAAQHEPERRALEADSSPRYQTRAIEQSPGRKGPKKSRRRDSLLGKVA